MAGKVEIGGGGPWFDGSPIPMFETRLTELNAVLRAIYKQTGPVKAFTDLTAEHVDAIRRAHLHIDLVRANQATLDFLRVTADELRDQWPTTLATALKSALDENHIMQLFSGAGVTQWTAEWPLPNGGVLAAKVVSKPLPGFERTMESVCNTLMDVTEHRREARLMFEDNPTPSIEFEMTEVARRIMAAVASGLTGEDLRAAIDRAHDYMRASRVNAAAERLFQLSAADIVADATRLLTPEMRSAAVNAMHESLERRVLQRPFVAPVLRPDGSVRHVISRSRAIGPADNPWGRTQLTYTDVTITREAELAAQAKVELARADAERQRARWERGAALAGAASYEVDIVTRQFMPSHSLEALVGASVDEMNATAQFFYPLVPEPWRSQMVRLFAESARSRLPSEFEHPLDRPDGRRVWLRSHFMVDDAGDAEPTTGFGYLQDITERKGLEARALKAVQEAQLALHERRSMMAGFLESSTSAPETLDPDELAQDLSLLLDRQLSVLREIKDRDAALARVFAALTEARERAEAANIAKSQFLAVMSHELRTPLNAVIGYTEILKEELEGASDQSRNDLDRIAQAGRHLLALINEVLDFAKIDAGRMELAREPVDLAGAIAVAADMVRPQAEAKGIQFSVEIIAGFGLALTDGVRFKQCVLNLLSNALKFTEAGQVRLVAQPVALGGGPGLKVDVWDTGCGIPQDMQDQLFEPFRQVDSSFARRHEGTGLGLAITRRLARLMGGDLTVTSMVGEGSCFTLTIATPACDEAAAAA